MKTYWMLMVLVVAVGVAGCGQRVYPKAPEGRVVDSSAF